MDDIPHSPYDRFIDRYIDDSSYINTIRLATFGAASGLVGLHV